MTPKTEKDAVVFRINKFWRSFFYISSPLLVGLMGWGVFQVTDFEGHVIMGVIFACFVWLFGYCVSMVTRSRIEIRSDEVLYTEALKTKVFPLDQLEGFRILPTQYIKTLVLIPRGSRPKKVKVPLWFQNSDQLLAALEERIPNLDQADYLASLQEVYRESQLGDNPEGKAKNLKQVRKWCQWVNKIAVGLCFWTIIYPRPYELTIWGVLLLPLACLFLLKKFEGIARFSPKQNSAYPSLDKALLVSPLVLTIRVLVDWNVLDWQAFWSPFAIITVGGCLIALVWVKELRRNLGGTFMFVVFTAIFAFGATVSLNGILADHSSPAITYHAKVLGKHSASGKHAEFFLTVSPWGDRSCNDDVTVSREVYNKYPVGDAVEIRVWKGKFGIPFYFVR